MIQCIWSALRGENSLRRAFPWQRILVPQLRHCGFGMGTVPVFNAMVDLYIADDTTCKGGLQQMNPGRMDSPSAEWMRKN
jgi:hypothetical protein